MSVKIKILITVLVLITLSSLVYSNILKAEAEKYQMAATLAQQEAEWQHKAAEANAREAINKAEEMAAKMVKVYMEFEKCKNGEEFNDIALDPSISKNIVPFKE